MRGLGRLRRAGREPRIFCVGLNKCGTTSLDHLFRASGLRSVSSGNAKIRPAAVTMFANLSTYRPLITGLERFTAFSDLNYLDGKVYVDAHVLFERLDAEHPGALFVLNTRPKDAWLRSRSQHVSPKGRSYLDRFASAFQVGPDEVLQIWSDQWDRHHAAVRSHFAGRDDRFSEFDISCDEPPGLARFLRPHRIRWRRWGQHNSSENRAYEVQGARGGGPG